MTRPDPDSADQSANKDEDAVWLDLVARLESTNSSSADSAKGNEPTEPGAPGSVPPPARKPFSAFDPLGLATPAAGTEDSGEEHRPHRELAEGSQPPLAGPRDFEVDDDDDGAFVPEEPPSLAGTEPLTMLAWLGAVGGPIALLFTAMFWRSAPLAAVLGIVAAFVASVVYLIMRLPHEKDEYDDGARI